MRTLEQFKARRRHEWERIVSESLGENSRLSDSGNHKFQEYLEHELQQSHVELVRNVQNAFVIALRALEVNENSIIFIPRFAPIELFEGLSIVNSKLVLIDLHSSTYTLDIKDLQEKLRLFDNLEVYNKRIILCIDNFGLPCDYPAIEKIAERYHAQTISLAYHGPGASINQQKLGSLADLNILNFSDKSTVKSLFEAASLSTNNQFLEKQIILWNGNSYNKQNASFDTPARDARIYPLESYWLLHAMQIYADLEQDRLIEIANFYSSHLYDVLKTPFVPAAFASAWQSYVIQCPNWELRNKFIQELKLSGFKAEIPDYYDYKIILKDSALWDNILLNDQSDSNTEELDIADIWLQLPFNPYMDLSDVKEVIKICRRFWTDT